MANVKSLSDAESREERIEKIGGIGSAYSLAETRGRRADAVCEKDEVGEWESGGVEEWGSGGVREWASGGVREWRSGGVGEWASGGEERTGLDQRRRAAAEPAFRLAWFGGPALEFRGNCAAERVKPLACLGADRNNSDGCCSRADACAPCGFGYAESSLRCAAVHSRSTALRPKTMVSRFLLSSDCRA